MTVQYKRVKENFILSQIDSHACDAETRLNERCRRPAQCGTTGHVVRDIVEWLYRSFPQVGVTKTAPYYHRLCSYSRMRVVSNTPVPVKAPPAGSSYKIKKKLPFQLIWTFF